MISIDARYKQVNALSKAISKLEHALALEPQGGSNEQNLIDALHNCKSAMLNISNEIVKVLNSK